MTTRIIVACSVLSIAATAGAQPSARIAIGRNVQVSKDRPNTFHYELLAAADPENPDRLIACGEAADAALTRMTNVVYVSRDGGATWKQTLDMDEDLQHTGDPACGFGTGGAAYALGLGSGTQEPTTLGSRTLVARSMDGGLTWSKPVPFPYVDREYLTVDRTNGKYAGRVYVNGTGSFRSLDTTRSNALMVFRSVDGGQTNAGTAVREATLPRWVLGMGNGVVMSDGTVAFLYGVAKSVLLPYGPFAPPTNSQAHPVSDIWLATSRDGGESLDAPTKVSDWYGDFARPGALPSLAVDPGSPSFKDRLYAVWTDRQEGRYRPGRSRVMLSYSADHGRTWSPGRYVDDSRASASNSAAPDVDHPAIAVNKDGVVLVAWYDRREHTDNLSWDIRAAASLDGGETWTPSVKVSEAPNTFGGKEAWPAQALRHDVPGGPNGVQILVGLGANGFFFDMGHTSGLAVDARGVFHPVWADNRTGISQMWTAPVTVDGSVMPNGSRELADYVDISSTVAVRMFKTSYDRATNTLTTTIRIRNTSRVPLRAPVRLRLVALDSDLGVPTVRNADNGERGPGAVWDVTDLLPNGVLAPGTLSGEKQLAFALSDVRQPRWETPRWLLRLTVRALTRSASGS